MRRAILFCAAIVFAIACGDNITEPIPDRTPTLAPSFATTTTEDGLSISTDKDDYQPGDVVHFTGSGWQPEDTLDIVLTDDPLTHDPHRWTVQVASDGTFQDDTYVVDEGDLDVKFTLVATSRATGRSLTVQFTDGNLTGLAIAAPTSVTVLQGNTAQYTIKVTMGGNATACTVTLSVLNVGTTFPAGAVPSIIGTNPTTTNSTNASFDRTLSITTAATAAPGSYPFTVQAERGGNCQGTGNLTTTGTLVIQAAAVATSTELTSSPNPSGFGQSVTFTASVTTGTSTPVTAGGVTFKEGTCASGTVLSGATPVALNGSGQAAFTTSTLSLGSHTIRACYGGATGFLSSEDDVSQQVNNNATLVEVTSSVPEPVTGQSVTITATVKSGGSSIGANGSVTFRAGGDDCSTGDVVKAATALDGNGQATYTNAFTASGSPYVIRACYGGATGFNPGSGTLNLVVKKAATTTQVVSTKATTVFSEPVTFNVTVTTDAPGSGVPAGNVTLKDGSCAALSSLAGPNALDATGKFSFSNIANVAVGTRTIVACYAGNNDFNESDGSVLQTVTQALTTTTVVSSDANSVFSQSVTFTATVVADAPATETPNGTVTFHDGAACSDAQIGGPKTLSAGGVATSDATTSLSVATHTITACYAGNTNFKDSKGSVSQVVDRASTTTSITSSDAQSVFSQSVSFTATVTAEVAATVTPDGSVTFHDGVDCSASQIGGAKTLSASGIAISDATTGLSVGTHTITACYAGNTNFKDSNGNVAQLVDEATTQTAISTSGSPSILHQSVTFTATVTADAPATATPDGSVTFHDGVDCSASQIGGAKTLSAGGIATSDATTTLSVGSHTITACYAGNTSFKSSSNSLSQQVNYKFDGLYAPVDRPNTMNLSKAGQAVPLKWRLTDFNNAPVLDFSPAALGVAVSGMVCVVNASLDQIEEYAGNSGLQNLGDGYYQFNWKTPTSYANSCKAIGLNLGEGTPRGPLAYFNFKK